jgi:hypothetical protein
MLQLQLLELVQKQFPDLDFDKKADLIRVEKVLKAEAKLDSSVKVNDLERMLSFLKKHGGKFIPILKDKNIARILYGKREKLERKPFPALDFDTETLEAFQEEFANNTFNYLTQCIKENDWRNLITVFACYSFLISDVIEDEILQTLRLKNQSITTAVHQHRYIEFVNSNPYAIDKKYYAMLSTINEYYFEDDIMNLNNAVVANQRNSKHNLRFLGKILYAATYFVAFSDNLIETLSGNRDVAARWGYPVTAMFRGKWKLFSILQVLLVIAVILGTVFIIPNNAGAGIGLAIFVVRIVFALRNKKS